MRGNIKPSPGWNDSGPFANILAGTARGFPMRRRCEAGCSKLPARRRSNELWRIVAAGSWRNVLLRKALFSKKRLSQPFNRLPSVHPNPCGLSWLQRRRDGMNCWRFSGCHSKSRPRRSSRRSSPIFPQTDKPLNSPRARLGLVCARSPMHLFSAVIR